MTDTNGSNGQLKTNRRPFFVVLGLFFAPLLLAFAVYYGSGWRPTGTTNKGDLITPAIPLPEVTLNKSDGTPTDASLLRNTWNLVYIGAGDCDDVCRKALAGMRDARLLLGKDISRVSRVFFYSGACCAAEYFAAEQPGLLSVSIDGAAGKTLLELFPQQDGPQQDGLGVLDSQRVYIVDPLGNLMMSYAAGTDARAIYQDLKKLLNLSHIG